ncbi:ABC transporter permease [Azospirillum picis]|uniref:Cu-processing system permease protein n=1 Tax=Azospirillum picis TaxID=488438 RepID=A0ABU0MN43_9PROT|nr:ABC transporter permease subunit [Azospirillum picis]MBP2301145.1 Cu-processing system permease protein [Azospirillum picis]MDQ0534893.1 Cu-processing system permease protein [Azospirillum picis]
MNTLLIIAGKELREATRNRWVVATTLLMGALALTLSFLGSAPTGTVGVGPVEVTIVSLSSLTIFLLPLIALLLSFDAVVGEIDRGTMTLLLSYPVARWQLLLGKFLGHAAVIALATVVGYGAAGLTMAMGDTPIGPESWRAFAAMIGSSVMLGAAFTALGYLASTLVRDRGTAAGIAVAVWLCFVLLYDMALLGLLVAGSGIGVEALNWLLLANPADAYRLFNLTGFKGVSSFAGTAGLAAHVQLPAPMLLAVMAAWVAAPLALAAALFSRKQI